MSRTIVQNLLERTDLLKVMEEVQTALAEEQARREQFHQEVEADQKAEFINGEIIYHRPALHQHNLIVLKLAYTLFDYIQKDNSGAQLAVEKAMVRLIRNSFQPDLCYFGPEKAAQINGQTLFYPAPDLAVEVLSTSTEARDRGVKKADYALHGVQEYWLVDPDAQTLERHVLPPGAEQYPEPEVLRAPARLHSPLLPGFELEVGRIFAEHFPNSSGQSSPF